MDLERTIFWFNHDDYQYCRRVVCKVLKLLLNPKHSVAHVRKSILKVTFLNIITFIHVIYVSRYGADVISQDKR